MTGKLANPAPLGLMGFATTTWLLSLHNAGFFTADALGMVLSMAFVFGGSAQFVAGVLEYPKGNTFGFVAFCAYGAFWWTFAAFVEFFAAKVPAQFVAWYLLVWCAFSFVMWLGTFRANRALMLVFLALWPTFLLLGLGAWQGSAFITHLGGYLGLVTAVLAFYLAAAEILNEAYGQTILPIGPYASKHDDADLAQAHRA